MFTHSYKTGFIHGYCDKPHCMAQINDRTYWTKSYRAAQLLITKLCEGKNAI